jgi:hypothetical protein
MTRPHLVALRAWMVLERYESTEEHFLGREMPQSFRKNLRRFFLLIASLAHPTFCVSCSLGLKTMCLSW